MPTRRGSFYADLLMVIGSPQLSSKRKSRDLWKSSAPCERAGFFRCSSADFWRNLAPETGKKPSIFASVSIKSERLCRRIRHSVGFASLVSWQRIGNELACCHVPQPWRSRAGCRRGRACRKTGSAGRSAVEKVDDQRIGQHQGDAANPVFRTAEAARVMRDEQ